jgi:hypothetical protein
MSKSQEDFDPCQPSVEDSEQRCAKPYNTPCLIKLGNISDLTKGGGSISEDLGEAGEGFT